MTVKDMDRDAIRHGKITEKPLRERPKVPSWALKLTMAVTGLIFGGFVLIHMIGNLKIFLPDHDGEPAINVYGEFLRTVGEPLLPREGVLWIFRIVLLTALILHVYGAFALTGRAHKSRGKFRRTNLMGGLSSFATRTMLVSGLVLLLFIVFHILDLTLGVQPAASAVFEHGAVYANMVASFSRWPVTIFYIAAMMVLFVHLSHGLFTAVSDLGITGHRTRAVLLFISYLVPAAVMVGNISIPLAIALGWIH
ncbi:succinate dehydrogenase cytochrome b subunit [Corynebacterium sp. CCM 8835]|uniref:Succinate dehydrogenase cytochrome b subunit n=1 Tax=Corynebacterium antarcticum TaxID=2800405 RepID=A0ABS1FKY0_9CORY|nr:succinate dehydrogenase cytochrome b subunit [Corynebacterium antarcticum]MCK7642473.1 succinate dehydrogenase cytochrome b subunit [Corynebacterium antarcticum]MCK7660842.1 succinate dehydrogenase cytochrome b subunit [Corynebacterium antarcticum]MCL0245589.1 succinate dehydrogenase cytochrome b subunit [Corynebacterium antarcticum]MCX7491955.1 succinate dehydrogenase cytochrome b subunit [Corynebacterium antarcticum]MCX7540162.1 succinate dehydrogenase cytochrome b subunit [Corynebacteriu